MSTKLTLEHRREGHAYDGRIILMENSREAELDNFEQFSFARMMARLSKQANLWPEAAIHMLRTEREDLQPVVLDASTCRKLREDPAEVIRSMTVTMDAVPRIEKQFKDSIAVKDSVKLRLRAGHDTLADAFGDFVYMRLRPHETDGMQGECPFTGKWMGFGAHADNPEQLLLKTGRQTAHADWIPVELVGGSKTENPKWIRVKTAELLEHALAGKLPERFFIPRKWNKTSPWIDREELRQMYEKYMEEKEDVQ